MCGYFCSNQTLLCHCINENGWKKQIPFNLDCFGVLRAARSSGLSVTLSKNRPNKKQNIYLQLQLLSLATFLLLIVWVYLYPNLCSRLKNMHLFCTTVRFGHSRSSKVDDFGTNRKHVCYFLLVRHCDYGPILLRFWDTETYWLKIPYFSHPTIIWHPRSLCSL